MRALYKLISSFTDIPGWRTKRHIVVIESDDWGSIRMPSIESYNRLLAAGIRVDKCHYCTNDTVASTDDLELLFEVLTSVKDKNGKAAVITANSLVANPDFDRIKESGFQEYFSTLITDSIPKIRGCEHSLDLWKEGNEKGFFRLQSHGREHLNVLRWMHYLRNDYPETKIAFENGVYGISTTITSERRKSFLPALDYNNEQEQQFCCNAVQDGLFQFNKVFGFYSKSFIAPNYVWGETIEQTLKKNNVVYIQGNKFNTYISKERFQAKKRFRFIVSKTTNGLINLTRNVNFEPSEFGYKDWVNCCLKEIELAFRWFHPAIISSHRVNFIGSLNHQNRDRGLLLLSQLLNAIVKKWPDVEFMSSDELGRTIMQDKYGRS